MSLRKTFTLVLLAALAVHGTYRAGVEGWSCDDAFISYRYADNLVRGHGLVFNPGERVEGYTNPFWTLLIASAQTLGVIPTKSSIYLGIAAFLALAFLLGLRSWRRSQASGEAFLPLAAALVLAIPDIHTWTTGGLETMLFASLATIGIVATRGNPGTPRAVLAGILLGLTVFTRLDGGLFALVGVLSPWFGGDLRTIRKRVRLSLAIGIPVALINGAHLAWKYSYYGELLPTSFYAKSAADPYFSQGLIYLRLLVERNWFLIPALPIAGVLAAFGSKRGRSSDTGDPWVFAICAALFLGYVAYTGGDFMYARRAIPALPLLFLALEGAVLRSRTPLLMNAAAIGIVAAAALPKSIYGPGRWEIDSVADQTKFFTNQYHESRRQQAERIGDLLRETPVRAMFQGAMCSFAYYSRLPYLVENTGLTQMSLAKSPITERGHIGHEKAASIEWLHENRIHLIISKHDEVRRPEQNYNEVFVGDRTAMLVLFYEDEVMDALRGMDEVAFVPIEDVLADLRERMQTLPLEQAEQSAAVLWNYYFRGEGPKARAAEAEFLEIIRRRKADQNR